MEQENINKEEQKEIKIDSLKNYIKNLAKDEYSLKSISFSVNEQDKIFIIYFTWKREEYKKYFKERDIFRTNIKSYLKKYGYKLNIKKSNPAKYVFSR